MKLVVFVMKKTHLLEDFLFELAENGILGATIIDSTGMSGKKFDTDDLRMFIALKALFEQPKRKSKVVLIATKNEFVETIFEIIDKIYGSLDQPDTGIVFTLPIDKMKGINV